MKLPNPEQALIPFERLEGYSLNPSHAEGRHKAVIFQVERKVNLPHSQPWEKVIRYFLSRRNHLASRFFVLFNKFTESQTAQSLTNSKIQSRFKMEMG